MLGVIVLRMGQQTITTAVKSADGGGGDNVRRGSVPGLLLLLQRICWPSKGAGRAVAGAGRRQWTGVGGHRVGGGVLQRRLLPQRRVEQRSCIGGRTAVAVVVVVVALRQNRHRGRLLGNVVAELPVTGPEEGGAHSRGVQRIVAATRASRTAGQAVQVVQVVLLVKVDNVKGRQRRPGARLLLGRPSLRPPLLAVQLGGEYRQEADHRPEERH